ncbi:universal stress protein [Arcicella aquatica]|uniref:Universal stress protein n=1 Tax=Arcicella aquatica TaxID=217141 RepID=A0ABU5QRV4_9BACT|nr:universal stress protein [Arcicella aquatica]MEA5259808.1 universal stress protein [Arcicella aquatica]
MDTQAVQKILVPIDFSESSMNALHTAIGMAKRQHAQLILLHVVNISPLVNNKDDGTMISDSNLQTLLDTHQTNLRKLADKITNEEFIDCRAIIRTGWVCPEIVRATVDFYADLIVMGKHGVSGTKEFMMGSNAFNVLKNAYCPVLLVPSHRRFEAFKTIVYPIRPVEGAIQKYSMARNLLRENDAELIVVGLLENGEKASFEMLSQETFKLDKKLKEDNLKSQTGFYYCDSVVAKVLEKTTDFMADLLIITASIDHHIQDYYVGPFVQQIVHYARVPVLSIRPKPADAFVVKSINEDEENSEYPYPVQMLGII